MQIEPNTLGLLILICSSVFVFAWYLDSLTHANIAKVDMIDAELYTHRILILSSGLLQGCLLLFYWFDYEVLPFFIALIIIRTVHEIIDEVKFHKARCTFQETLLHFVMWLSILSQVGFLFYWGFFFHYAGLSELPVAYLVWGTILVGLMALVSWKEWFLTF